MQNKAGIEKRNAKTKEYRRTLEAIIKTNKCPFCPDNFKYHNKPILKQYQGWLATSNSWPYKNTRYHFVLIPIKHKINFSDLTNQDFQAVKYLVNWLNKKYKIKGGGLTLRFGEQNLTGATVRHLHFQLIVPQLKPKSKTATVVNFPIG
ncbi:MAG: hypothetical protein NTX00_01900 [Candidatus Parcubacteria bacterium]|nr:hypothetical protein [Candidatus Parcubacteria bacterium]